MRPRLLALLLAACGVAQAADDVRARLADVVVLRGHFVQDKQLQGFTRPLHSEGRFLLARERGVIWDTEVPFASTLVLGGEQLVARDADGGRRVLVDGSREPGLAAIQGLLLALVAGDLDALAAQFTIEETLHGDGWTLALVPTDPALARVFSRIELAGDRHVRRVALEERGGDRSVIVFDALVDAPAQLSREEAARFD